MTMMIILKINLLKIFAAEKPIEDICSSIEDLDVIIVKTGNLRTQYRSNHQEMRISLGNQYNETYEVNYEEKLALMRNISRK